MRFIIIYLFLFIVNISFSSTSTYNNKTLKARELIFDFKFNDAQKILENEKTPISLYLQSYSIFIKNILIGGDESYTLFKNNFDLVLNQLDNLSDDDSLKNLLKSELYLQSSILKLMNKDFISGSYHFIKSYNLFKESKKNYPNLQQNLKLSGLYKIIAGITPEQGKKFIEIIGLEGNINDGYKELNKYLQLVKNNKKLYVEAYALNKLVYIFLKEDLSLKNFNYSVNINYKNNSTIVFTEILNNYKNGNYYKLKRNKEIIETNNIIEIPLLYYFLGVSSTVINTNESIKNLYKYIKTSKSQHFIKSSYWQLARIAILQENKENYIKLKNYTLALGESFTESDKQAEYEAKETIIPNKNLLKARLLFDAKKYKPALEELSIIILKELNNMEYKAEYFYRKGRIEFELKNFNKAKIDFSKVLSGYTDVKKYYIPYSALNISYIYREENNKIKQKEYLLLTLKLNKYEYQNSIKHKAKANLKQIE